MSAVPESAGHGAKARVPAPLIGLAWVWVATPFAYGLWQLLIKVSSLFGN